jgi:hypothetical protein
MNTREEAQNQNRISRLFQGNGLTESVNPKTETLKENPKWVIVKKFGSLCNR